MKKITNKIILLSMVTGILIALMVGTISIYSIFRITNERISGMDSILRQNYDSLIKQEVQTVISVLQGIYEKSQRDELTVDEAKKEGIAVIRSMRFGDDNSNYFWIDSTDGLKIMQPIKPQLEGENSYNDQDVDGNYYKKEQISVALSGGGFTDYWFTKPNETNPSPKRSYTLAFKPFDWVIGTGNYIDDIDAVVSQNKKLAIGTNTKLIKMMLICSIIVLVILIVISYYIGKKISKPIIYLTNYAESIAQADITNEISKDLLERKDEIGRLASSFSIMINNLRQIIEKTVDISEQVASSSEELSASGEQVGVIANQVSNAIQNVASTAENQSVKIDEITKNVQELMGNIRSIGEKSNEMTNSANGVMDSIKKGNQSISGSVSMITEVEEDSIEVADVIRELGNNSERIGNILDVINGIASQTNLLALNASIEAARAGEAGRGFSVVADEIRDLAAESANATFEIADLIQQIQGNVSLAVEKMNKNKSTVKQGVDTIKDTGRVFEEIEILAMRLVDIIREVAENTKQMTQNSKEVEKGISYISSASYEFAGNSEEVAASSEEQSASTEEIISFAKHLGEMAEELLDTVNRFKIHRT